MKDLLERFEELRVAVVGDLILDRYTWGSVSRISPEAPVPVVNVEERDEKLGGAGNAAQALTALGSSVTLLARLGEDRPGERLRSMLEERRIEFQGLPNGPSCPTTVKTRVIAGNQHLLRLDSEDRSPMESGGLATDRKPLTETLRVHDVVLLSDYGKGVLNPDTLSFWNELASETSTPVVVDPHVDHFSLYDRATIMTPNENELRQGMGFSGPQTPELDELAARCVRELDLGALLVTRGEKGMVLYRPDRERFELATRAREVYDVTGAGDTVAALITLGEAMDVSRERIMRLANLAAGLVVGKMGTAAITRQQLEESLEDE